MLIRLDNQEIVVLPKNTTDSQLALVREVLVPHPNSHKSIENHGIFSIEQRAKISSQ